ncbi:MAG: sigma-54-dependent transcriptional regulator, partial [Thermodesulfobacteriota bacterium]
MIEDSGARSGALAEEGTKNSRILIADGDHSLLVYMRELLTRFGYEVFCSDTEEKALHLLRTVRPAIVFLDLHLPGKDGLETLQQMKRFSADTYIVMMSGDGLAKAVVTTMKMGAMDFLHKPFDQEELLATVGKQMDRRDLIDEAKFLREEIKRKAEFNRLFQNSAKMQEIQAVVEQVADTDITLLIQGESGTGKELVARAIYTLSARRDRPFLKVNCAALPEPLLESEMFGYEKGAFTDASTRKPGKFELADGGTIFLDEISEMMPPLQAKLLQVLQDKQFTHLGGKQDIRVDVRIIAATNQNLSESVAQGRFREDLYYRL